MSEFLIFEHIKSDFAGDAEVGRANMKITFDKFNAPSTGGYAYQTDTNFYYKGVQYTSLIVENVTITGIMKVNGATPMIKRSNVPELFNFIMIKDEKSKEGFANALKDPVNKGILTIENKEDGTSTVKPVLLKKEYSANIMWNNKDGIPFEDPPVLLKIRVQPTLKYIYSCAIDICRPNGICEPLIPKRPMPQNSLSDIKKSMKSQFDFYFGKKDVDAMFANKEFVHDLPMSIDIIDNITAYSKIIRAEFELNCKCNVSKQTPWINCDFLPAYLLIKPNPKYDIESKVSRMRNFVSTISQDDLNKFDDIPEDDGNNNNL